MTQSIIFSENRDYLEILDFLEKKNIIEVKNKRRLLLAWLAKGFREKKKSVKKMKEKMNILSKSDL